MSDNNNPYANNNEPNNQDTNQNQNDQTGNQQPYGQHQQPQYQSPDWMNGQYNQNQQNNQNQPYDQNQQYNQNPYNQQYYSQYQPNQPQNNGMAIGALVCGILGFLLSCCWFISLPLSIISIILGIIVLKKNKAGRTMAIIGIILGAITVIIAIGVIAVSVFSFSSGEFGNLYQQYYDEITREIDPSVY